jgi:predicted sugar kinase
VAPLERREALPGDWRFALITPRQAQGLSGQVESQAFDRLTPVPAETSRKLAQLAREVILPAAAEGRFEPFAEGIFEYGYRAGVCFAPVQGGAFGSAAAARLVEDVRRMGVRGVGQSSWGPTVFALCDSPASASQLSGRLRSEYGPDSLDLIVSEPDNQGACIETDGQLARVRSSRV